MEERSRIARSGESHPQHVRPRDRRPLTLPEPHFGQL